MHWEQVPGMMQTHELKRAQTSGTVWWGGGTVGNSKSCISFFNFPFEIQIWRSIFDFNFQIQNEDFVSCTKNENENGFFYVFQSFVVISRKECRNSDLRLFYRKGGSLFLVKQLLYQTIFDLYFEFKN